MYLIYNMFHGVRISYPFLHSARMGEVQTYKLCRASRSITYVFTSIIPILNILTRQDFLL